MEPQHDIDAAGKLAAPLARSLSLLIGTKWSAHVSDNGAHYATLKEEGTGLVLALSSAWSTGKKGKATIAPAQVYYTGSRDSVTVYNAERNRVDRPSIGVSYNRGADATSPGGHLPPDASGGKLNTMANTRPPSELVAFLRAQMEADAKRGRSQRALARAAGMTWTRLNNWSHGDEPAAIADLEQLLDALGWQLQPKRKRVPTL